MFLLQKKKKKKENHFYGLYIHISERFPTTNSPHNNLSIITYVSLYVIYVSAIQTIGLKYIYLHNEQKNIKSLITYLIKRHVRISPRISIRP